VRVISALSREAISALLALAILPGCATAAGRKATPAGDFTFIVTSDVHFGAFPESRQWLETMIREVNAMDPLPAFILNCGDVTERGWESEWAGFQASVAQSRVPFYNTPGNHDVKWADMGKGRFRKYNKGSTYYSFDHGPYHFVSLDVTVTLQQYAHVERAVFDWLREDLEAVGTERPVILFMHHPLGRWKFYADNQYEVLKALAGHNVKVMFHGHEHNEEIWNENGVTQSNVDNLYGDRTRADWYRIVEVRDGRMTVSSKRPGEAPVVPRAVIGTARDLDSGNVVIRNPPGPLAGGGTLYAFEAGVSSGDLTPSYIGAEISDDGVSWDGSDGFYQFSVTTRPHHDSVLKVRINRNSGLLAVALQARTGHGGWHTIGWAARSHDDNCGARCIPVDGQYWSDLKFRVPKGTAGPFRLVSFEPDAPEINAFRIWLKDPHGDVIDEIDAGDAASEAEHSVSVRGETGRERISAKYPTAVRYWLDTTYLAGGRRPMERTEDGLWRATFDTSSEKPGRHTVKVQVFDDLGRAFTDFVEFTIAGGSFRTIAKLATRGGVQSSPALAGGLLYVGSNDGKVYAFRPPHEEPVWTFRTGDQVTSSPTVVNGVVYVGSADFKLYALDAVTGHPIWDFATEGPIFGGAEFADGVLYVGSGDHRLYAVDAESGRERWRFTVENANALIQMRPTYHDGVVYFGAWDTYVYAVAAADGGLRWRTRIPDSSFFYRAPAYQSPRVVGDRLLVSAPTGVHYLLDLASGAFVGDPFPMPASSFGYNDVWLEGPIAYSVSFGGTLAAYDLVGPAPAELWRATLGLQVVNSGLILSDGQLFAGGFQDRGPTAIHGNLIVFDPRSRTTRAHSVAAQGWIFSTAAVEKGVAYLGSLDGNVHVVKLEPDRERP